ncbi:hypothetical protein LIER_36933 [Lithospermum erythrorhizon]|uniref:DUF3511 domain protein n=1 Tax=Lithospermum erythrorhizon TaxID=34254 RepID=A0AAV3PGZ8_LITER
MDDFRPSFKASGSGDRRLEIVSGKGFNSTPDMKHSEAAPKTNQVASSSSSSSKSWKFNDPEMRRKKRIVKYKVYSIEGKVKASIKNSFRWIKNKCSEIVHGY